MTGNEHAVCRLLYFVYQNIDALNIARYGAYLHDK